MCVFASSSQALAVEVSSGLKFHKIPDLGAFIKEFKFKFRHVQICLSDYYIKKNGQLYFYLSIFTCAA